MLGSPSSTPTSASRGAASTKRRTDRIAAETTRIIHSAATVYFAERLEESRRINVTGTIHMLALAEEAQRAGALRSFVHVSTAYVSGLRTGLVREDELDLQQKFRNTYEQTKCEAEALVRRRQADLPIVIARPSVVVGDSQTGITTSFKTVYWPLKVYASRRWRTVPGYPDTVIDLVPVDFVASGIVHLAFDDRAPGQCVHLSAGPEGSMTVGEVTKLAAEMFKVKPVRFVNPSLFMAVVRPLVMYLLRGSRRRILRDGHVYLPVLLHEDAVRHDRGRAAPPPRRHRPAQRARLHRAGVPVLPRLGLGRPAGAGQGHDHWLPIAPLRAIL